MSIGLLICLAGARHAASPVRAELPSGAINQ
jgi:hypothetical protein